MTLLFIALIQSVNLVRLHQETKWDAFKVFFTFSCFLSWLP